MFSLTQEVVDNQYVLTASVRGIEAHEDSLGIKANPLTESLEFRRERIINRLSMMPPFTMRFLKRKLDDIIGVGKWTAHIDSDNYTLYIESAAANQLWFHEILVTLARSKPANIVFMNTPLLFAGVVASEKINRVKATYNYRVGTIWELGLRPFVDLEIKEVLKMAETPSIQPQLLNDIATFTANDVKSVRLNGSYIVQAPINRRANVETAVVFYTVAPVASIKEVTKIELLSANNAVLSVANVYIPLLAEMTIQHTINFREGI